MKAFKIVSIVILAIALFGGMTAYSFANAPEKGSMGVWGYVAAEKFAQLEVDNQPGVNKLKVRLAKTPADAWIVVHTDDNGMPGERVGAARISKGVNRDVEIPLKGVTSEKVIVAIHADRGTPGKLDFDMKDKTGSPDRPFFVGGKELAKIVTVRTWGVKDDSGTAAIQVDDQSLTNSTLVVASAAAPTPAWIVVHLDDKGMPGKRVGVAPIPAGVSSNVAVPLDPKVDLSKGLLVAVHADRGTPGEFDFNMEDKFNSPDQPFFVDGKEVATAVSVR